MLCRNRKDAVSVNSGGSVFASSQLIRQTRFHLPFRVFQLLLNPEMVKACPTLISYVYDFLENKAYSKGKGEFARKVPLSTQQTTSVTAACPRFFCLFPKCINLFCRVAPSDRHIRKPSEELHEEHVQRGEGAARQSG